MSDEQRQRVRLELTEDEMRAFHQLAASHGLSKAAMAHKLVRDAIDAAAPSDAPPKKPAKKK